MGNVKWITLRIIFSSPSAEIGSAERRTGLPNRLNCTQARNEPKLSQREEASAGGGV